MSHAVPAGTRRVLVTSALLGAVGLPPQAAQRPDQGRCGAAEQFLTQQFGMIAISQADTINDWRTHQVVPGCRITAAGLTSQGFAETARSFYDQLRAAGWTRTPDPRDAPHEASLRFRRDETDCLFSFYSESALATEAEIEVNNALEPDPGQRRFNFLVQCMPSQEAAPR